MNDVYVIALLGTSPGVITEMLWYLAAIEKRRIVGVEVWTTANAWYEKRNVLAAAVGALRQVVPAPPLVGSGQIDPDHALDHPPALSEIRVFVPRNYQDRPVQDIVDRDDAEVYSQALHIRVEYLSRHDLPPWIGAIAGGRKTMSAGLMSAFGLHARAEDRLVHIVLHGAVEATLRAERTLDDYWFPRGTVADQSPESQLFVYDVPYFPAATLSSNVSAGTLRDTARAALQQRRLDAVPRLSIQLHGAKARIQVGPADFLVACKTALAFAWLVERAGTSFSAHEVHAAVNEALTQHVPHTGLLTMNSDRTLERLAEDLREGLAPQPRWAARVRLQRHLPERRPRGAAMAACWTASVHPPVERDWGSFSELLHRLFPR